MKTYFLKFGVGNISTLTGLNPTLLVFSSTAGNITLKPGITAVPGAAGYYYFNYSATLAIAYLADAATTSPGASLRYQTGLIDPSDLNDETASTLTALSSTLYAQYSSLQLALGSQSSDPGDIHNDPVDLFGYLLRLHEINEGKKSYTKASSAGSDSLLRFFNIAGTTLMNLYNISNNSTFIIKSNA